MSLSRVHVTVIGVWFSLVAVIAVVASAMGYRLSLTTGVLALAVAIAAPVVLLMIFRGAPERSTVELIYDVEHPSATNSEKRS